MTTTLPAPPTRAALVGGRRSGKTATMTAAYAATPGARLVLSQNRASTICQSVAEIASTWLASDDPTFRAMGRRAGRNLAADILDDALIGLRRDITRDLTTARTTVGDIAEETQVYLEAALSPDITYTDVNAYVTWVFDAAAGHPDEHPHAAALAAAALRGWAERTRLAGGAR
ncbi:hypothetical protein ACFWE5_03810 [Cellulosimicrobium funkei]|uniref:hypothetical protein n=1 Tax=Cellulosimicrobium funkei TaxID=264251 RepID=UPI0036620FC2